MKTHILPRKTALKAVAFCLLTTFGVVNHVLADNPPTGATKGRFTVNSENEKVYFSQGNLQYQASTNTWRFAENQYDFVGNDNMNISSTYDGWIDLFGWGTSGYNHGAVCYQPWSISSGGGFNGSGSQFYYAYGNRTYDLNDQTGQADWGYNAISNGGNEENQWRTLSRDEWKYIFDLRSTPSGLRYAKATVNDVHGVILLPDGWDATTYVLNNPNVFFSHYADNVISLSDWTLMEAAGAVFLPSGGGRFGTNISGCNENGEKVKGNYWSTTHEDDDGAYYVMVSDASLSPEWSQYRFVGLSVRLVQAAPSVNYIMQTTDFTSGWNWYSTCVDQNDVDGLSLLQNGIGENGLQIKSQQQYLNYYEGMGWMGTLTEIANESTYKIKNMAPCTVSIIGLEAISEQHPITLTPGWNWIGYPYSEPLSIETAFSNISLSDGDLVKSLDGYSTYYEGLGWMGGLRTITPGMGLLYKSYNSQDVVLVYPENTRGVELVENITAKENHWVPDMHAYPDNMNLTAVVELDGMELKGENFEIAAFADGECRGSARLLYIEPLQRYLAFLTIVGEEADELSFGLYNTETGEECFDSEAMFAFTNNVVMGNPKEPTVLSFRGKEEYTGDFQVYPNPSNTVLNIIGDNVEYSYTLFNSLGQAVTSGTACGIEQINVASMEKGVYFLHLISGSKASVQKVVVK